MSNIAPIVTGEAIANSTAIFASAVSINGVNVPSIVTFKVMLAVACHIRYRHGVNVATVRQSRIRR